ncbi:MAG: leucine--tRNA ligase [Acidimicrobiia bacterium]|nr:leucine--tRNA ligase [Acidimicrobiia bacterium]
MSYDHKKIEAKWQKFWAEEGTFSVTEDESRTKYFNVSMYPYPSGELHMGHLRNYTYADLLTRYRTMQGYNVLSPMGWDSFGLPAENHAIQTGVHPRESTERQIEAMKRQLRALGAVYDWDREVAAHTPEYYRWDQWLFLKLYERGLAYKEKAPVNWCPNDQTVLANEQVVDGHCERCGATVERRELSQWFFRITEYADRLLDDLDQLDDWPDRVRTMQRNWIGRSEGAAFDLKVADTDLGFEVFTTRPDTIFGMTFAVLAPEHPLVEALVAGTDSETEVHEYRRGAAMLSEVDRIGEGEKSGVFTGRFAINPVNDRRVPIYVADYVLMGYGTGAIMAVPGQDQRDWDFAQKYGIEIIRTVQPPTDFEGEAYTGEGATINSDFLDGMDVAPAIAATVKWLEERELGRATTNYRLRDWLVSRQRYWGCPIPMVDCPECGFVPVPEEDLPVQLPDLNDYQPKGKAPLAAVESFVSTTCPNCGGPARRETDTMDTFVDSSWYFLRYTDPHNERAIFDRDKADYWMPIDQYMGGVEHAVLHLLYARFITKVLHDMDLVSVEEPFARLFTQGMLVKDGAKMSKSKGNVVAPDTYYDKFGADAIRMFELFMGPPTDDAVWSDNGVEGTSRFLDRLSRVVTGETGEVVDRTPTPTDSELLAEAHRTIQKVTDDIDRFAFNTTVPAMMTLVNNLVDQLREGMAREVFDEVVDILLRLLSPMAPHIAHELWEMTGHTTVLATESWPVSDPELARREVVTMVVQVNGKVRDRVDVDADISAKDAEGIARDRDRIKEFVNGKKVRKVIVREPRLVNFVVG